MKKILAQTLPLVQWWLMCVEMDKSIIQISDARHNTTKPFNINKSLEHKAKND